jgi:Fur family ferric uptake transcriptional regulator
MRTTKARTIIRDIVNAAPRPIDSAEIVQRVAKKDTSINRATVFRTLNTLTASGEIHRLELGAGKYLYESARRPHHHHLVCVRCKRIEDFTQCDVEKSAQAVAKAKNFTLTNHTFELYGVCGNCQD